jgi:hypothetical protein
LNSVCHLLWQKYADPELQQAVAGKLRREGVVRVRTKEDTAARGVYRLLVE